MRSLPDTSTHKQQWKLNPRQFDLESNALSTRPYAPAQLKRHIVYYRSKQFFIFVYSYVYDVKATYIEGGKLRYKAEISLDGSQVVAQYIRKVGTDMGKVRKVRRESNNNLFEYR